MNKIAHLNFGIVTFAAFIGVVNSFFYASFEIMLILCTIEVLLLLFAFLRKDYTLYICLYMLFLAFSMESDNFVGGDDFYGFKNFRIFGVNLAAWMILPITIKSILYLKELKQLNEIHVAVFKRLTFFTVCGSIMGCVIYLLDDYGFRSKGGSLKEMISTYYTFFMPYITFLSLTWVMLRESTEIARIKQYLFSCIPATAIVFVFCLIFGNYGNRMGNESLQVSEIYFLLVASLVLMFFSEFNINEKVIILISGSIISFLSITYNASGKILIIMMLTPLIWLYVLHKQNIVRFSFRHILLIIIVVIVFVQVVPIIMGTDNNVLTSKMNDVSGLLSFFVTGDLMLIPGSPQMRITEFINVAYEYVLHPWFLFLGKGFIGSIQDHLGLFPLIDESAFSEWQLELGAYHSLHESFNVFFLVGGLSGLYVLFNSLTKIFRNINHSPWLVLGGLWLLLFYGYHMNVSIYGLTCLVTGLMEVKKGHC